MREDIKLNKSAPQKLSYEILNPANLHQVYNPLMSGNFLAFKSRMCNLLHYPNL